ncbi:MAG: bifunctional alpha,alpha-trehalose-phosphate synthase (UDP-forming)/trehalose-phosphatase [Pseudomonadota bacterium]|nr:bifunctional alpha,alpha-trehalose-phosphate synthase (UDP-forming)/trehalose-phosphatase [Pseudomonadota bacterium]
MPRLILVSNRLPVTVRLEGGQVFVERSAGGLATGLQGIHAQAETVWVGWPGDTSRLTDEQRAELTRGLDTMRVRTVPLSPAEVARYYDGFANGVLWPLFHYLIDRVPLEAASWETYVRVNQRFADIVAEQAHPGDHVWVHDYHLCLVPGMLRQRLPRLRIGFFLHIPFPSGEVFRTLAWRTPLLEGLLGADVIGFHTASYRRHFANSVGLLLGHRVARAARGDDVHQIFVNGRGVALVVAPMGVDAVGIGDTARSRAVDAQAASLRQPGTRLLLGVDRLDYTKGIPRRMLAFERLLEREPALRGRVRLLQVAVPSRERVDAYRQIRRQVEEHVGRINGLYTQGAAVPIHYVYRSLSEAEVIAHYRAADVMLVTPLRDGMNLVAKEFVAARSDLDGVLLLSELAGAADELDAALLVNPYDINGVASAMARALTMPVGERRARMSSLRARVEAADVHAWAQRFLRHLDEAPARVGPSAATPARRLDDVLAALRSAPRRLLLLDYDGTLVPFAARPELAAPDAPLLTLIRRVAETPGTALHLVSGRRRADLERWFGQLPIGLHAEHGLWTRWPGKTSWEMRPLPPDTWMNVIRPAFEAWVTRLPGSAIEEKTASLAFHYRETGLLDAPEELRRAAEEYARWLPIDVLPGNRVLEVRARGTNKGAIITALRDRGELEGVVLALGDDTTDADLFAALPPEAHTVQVGDVPLPARHRVDGVEGARALLERLVVREEV